MTTLQPPAQIPGPPDVPILGWRKNVYDFATNSVDFLHRMNDTYGPMVQMGQGKMSATLTFHPDHTRQILSQPGRFYSYSLEDIPFAFNRIEALKSLTTAIALLNGEQHKRQRRLMAPAFHNNILPVYVEQITNLVEKFFHGWKPGDVVDVYQAMDLFTIFLSMELFIGMKADEDGRKFANLFETTLNLMFSPLTFLLPYDIPGFPFHQLKVQGSELEQQLKDLIKRRREKGLGGTDSLSLFLQAHDEDGTKMTDDEVIGETVAVFRGGSKTTASALTWNLFLLTQHPKAYSHLAEELAGTLRGASPTFEQLDELPLLDAVIKENLRLIPPVVWGGRYSMEDFELGGYHFGKGSTVLYSSHVTHRMPEIFADPYCFNPYRWETIKPSPYEYFPFNAGPRRCLGAEFAVMVLKITLAILLQRFHFSLIPNQRIQRVGLIGSLPKYGIKMRLDAPGGKFEKAPVKGNIHELVKLI
jgi:cytochrome P450